MIDYPEMQFSSSPHHEMASVCIYNLSGNLFSSSISCTMNTFAIVRNTVDILNIDWELDFLKDEERKAYYEAFSAFDWNH